MLTKEFLSNLLYNPKIESYNLIFEYLFLKNLEIDISTAEKVANCNVMLKELHFLKKFLTDKNRPNIDNVLPLHPEEEKRNSKKAQEIVDALAEAKYINYAQTMFLSQCIKSSTLWPYSFSDFCYASEIDPKFSDTHKVILSHYTDRTVSWKLVQKNKA